MLYNNWSYHLFDEFYPRYEILHGEIKWFTAETMKVKWGLNTHEIPLTELYDSNEENPVQKVLGWVYSNMPMLQEELEKAVISKDFITGLFTAHCKRDKQFYSERISELSKCSSYGKFDGIEDFVKLKLEGSILRIESNNKNIPASTFLSHKDLIDKYVGQHFYDYANIDLMFDATRHQPQRIIIGHENSIRRFTDDIADFRRISLLDWFNKLPEGKKNNE